MPKKASLAVIIPNYNHGHFLKKLIPSLLQQSSPADEILIIDDGSQDDSIAIITELCKLSKTVKFYQNITNKGVTYTLNKALNLTTCDYLTFPSADNFVLPGLYEKSLALLSKHPEAGLCCSDPMTYNEETGETRLVQLGLSQNPTYFSQKQAILLVKTGKLCVGNLVHTVIVKRQAMKEARLGDQYFIPELKWHCDFFTMNLIAFRHGICYIPEALAIFRIEKTSYSSLKRPWEERKNVYLSLLQFLNSSLYEDVKPAFIRSAILTELPPSILWVLITHPRFYFYFTPSFCRRLIWQLAKKSVRWTAKKIPFGERGYNWIKSFLIKRKEISL